MNSEMTIATPNPGAVALTGAGGISALLGWGAVVLGAKFGLPTEVTGAILGTVVTLGTSIWHRFFGPAVAVQKNS